MEVRRRLVLASSSTYRRQLLARLGVPFDCAAPAVDESPRAAESPMETACRLAHAKAMAVSAAHPDALIIGSDQVACLGAQRLDKPGSYEVAVRQLQALSGQTAGFHTAVCLLDARDQSRTDELVTCRVTFRVLSAATISAYLLKEQPYDCAGSAKSEGLGIALIERIDTPDPTALIGLPLIALTTMLARAGAPILP
ncbi:MAG: Maf family nucleotide pyrophosphatase [Proteobacteria bacterium]|nr:Maf family nucleotide pyrophosphatase [Pseudomonadota bacterium]